MRPELSARMAIAEELVEWLEDIAGGSRAQVVSVVSPDADARWWALTGFHHRLLEHPVLGRGLPSLMRGSLAAQAPRDWPTQSVVWLAVTATDEPCAEMVQLAEQLDRICRTPSSDIWMLEAGYSDFRAALAGPIVADTDEAADYAFASLGLAADARGPGINNALRYLDGLIEGSQLVPDGGALAVDAPRARARALLTAGWLSRLSASRPLVLVIDDAHKAGPYLIELVNRLRRSAAPILVVVAGQPDADGPIEHDGQMLAGGLRSSADTTIDVFCPPASSIGNLAIALAASTALPLFSMDRARAVATAFDPHQRADDQLDELVASGWLHCLTKDVYTFSSVALWRRARRHSGEFTGDLSERLNAVQVPDVTDHRSPLATLLEQHSAATAADHTEEDIWCYALSLSQWGELARAAELARPVARTALERALVGVWSHSVDEPPARMVQQLVEALHAPGEVRSDRSDRFAVARARIALSRGDLDLVDAELSNEIRDRLPRAPREMLESLDGLRSQPQLVARSVETTISLLAIDTLRMSVPGSEALAKVLLARIAMLEEFDRLGVVDDALVVADEAVAIYEQITQEPPTDAWRARAWRSWCQVRRGDHDAAIRSLDQLLHEQLAPRPEPDDDNVLSTKQWRARCLQAAGRAGEAIAEFDVVVELLQRKYDWTDERVFEARRWRAECLNHLRRYDDAAVDLSEYVRHRAATVAPHDEQLLLARHRLAAALGNSGRQALALSELEEVLRQRALIDLPDAPRTVAVHHAHAVTSLLLGHLDDALEELEFVVATRTEALAPDDPFLVKARCDRATCLVLLGRWHAALDDLDVVVPQLLLTSPPQDELLLTARQQRAMGLAAADRAGEALAELDDMITQVGHLLPSDNPLLVGILALRDALAPAEVQS